MTAYRDVKRGSLSAFSMLMMVLVVTRLVAVAKRVDRECVHGAKG